MALLGQRSGEGQVSKQEKEKRDACGDGLSSADGATGDNAVRPPSALVLQVIRTRVRGDGGTREGGSCGGLR